MSQVTINRPFNREKFFAAHPTLIGVVGNVRFYEHPTKGDESPLIAVTETECGVSDFWDLPTFQELFDVA